MRTTRTRSFPYENDEFDIRVGSFDDDGRNDDDDKNGLDDIKEGIGPNDDTLKGGEGLDALYGEGGDDHIYGGGGTDWLFGNNDQDDLFGEDGSDQLYGGDGNDFLDGGEESDWLDGGTGTDILVGGPDGDWLTGGSGYDTFLFNVAGNWYNPDSPSFNPDTILDYSSTDDQIVLEGSELVAVPGRYVEDTIAYGAGYDAAEMHAMSLLDGDKTYAFVTDGVDGYLFIEPWTSLPAIETVGIILEGLTSTSDFEWYNVMSVSSY
jgi:Ca2+-binding RTX toxin-like protein